MDPDDIRNLSEAEIENRIGEEQDQLRKLRFQHAVADLENPMILGQKRKLVARLKTILREKEMAAETA
ncbi:MAG: 50S ribosomal protein L29 [Bacteroidetes bacterium QS_8_64_10]|jgi:large subunit ribosomal protein L29|nr:MAG: 50S ribosomal protein L29 [Bacteroidetes bacterium QS_8_64_10]